ncbi:MAG: hypothetical protein SOV46_01425, partial [Candidatus Faecousia sp.]|nr:hypothetical protein [Candidatus Faecousia sp.]
PPSRRKIGRDYTAADHGCRFFLRFRTLHIRRLFCCCGKGNRYAVDHKAECQKERGGNAQYPSFGFFKGAPFPYVRCCFRDISGRQGSLLSRRSARETVLPLGGRKMIAIPYY